MPHQVRVGLDIADAAWPDQLNNTRISLLVHPASINSNIEHAVDICVKSRRFKVEALWGPQHGIRGETQDNMIEWEGFRDKRTGLPVYSLYGKTRCPDTKMIQDIDVVVIDLQDVGARYYTFIWTMALVMEVCKSENKSIVVLDRPNPIGGHLIEGPVLKQDYKSFVGLRPIPVRHGMTIGEIAMYLKDVYCSGLDLHIIQLEHWKRHMWFDNTKLPWVLPSPNMPTLDTAIVYPGMCLLEATNLSEGRGTTRPFEILGAPFIDPDLLVKHLSELNLPGVFFRPLSFIPTFHKYAGQLCGGIQIHVLNREQYKPFKTAIGVIKTVHNLYPGDFAWKNPPYEYEERLLPIDILAGTDRVRRDIENGLGLQEMELWWDSELTDFNQAVRQKYLLYS